jgi:phosphoribosyl 1,2-cyclic phosphodiesterase
VRVILCGVRGSTPAPGPSFVRYGGNTSCVALCHDGMAPTLILDAGTGIRNVDAILKRPYTGSILLGHLHWDHTQGLPFFRSGDHPDATVEVFMPAQGDAEAVLSGLMSSPFFPITPRELNGSSLPHHVRPGTRRTWGVSRGCDQARSRLRSAHS